MTTRRTFLKAGGLLGAGLALSEFTGTILRPAVAAVPGGITMFTEQLPIPPVLDGTGGGTFNLPMAAGTHRFHSALPPTPTWGYGGASYLGPTFVVKKGTGITVNATNNLGAHPLASYIDLGVHGAVPEDKTTPRAAVHLHGGNTEAAHDGLPEQTFLPGGSHSYAYGNTQQAGNLWYHDHALGITRLNVYAGLAGGYLVRDNVDTGQAGGPLGLPVGKYELPLILQDKQFNPDGTLAYADGRAIGTNRLWAPEFFGDVAVVNGKIWPNLDVDQALYRFHLYNGSNARFYRMTLAAGATVLTFFQIGTDTGLLNATVPLNTLLLGPGERADVLVDFRGLAAGTKVVLTNNAVTPFPSGPHGMHRGGVPLKQLMQFTVGTGVGPKTKIPKTLRTSPIPALSPVRQRNVSLVEILDSNGMPTMSLLNNLAYHDDRIADPKADTVEQWNIINTTADTHPIHLHLVQFQLRNRQAFNTAAYLAAAYPNLGPDSAGTGPYNDDDDKNLGVPAADTYVTKAPVGPAANEAGWKDTVRANPGEITRILVPFGAQVAAEAFGETFTGEYVWHCHILDHEDNEMMVRYTVTS